MASVAAAPLPLQQHPGCGGAADCSPFGRDLAAAASLLSSSSLSDAAPEHQQGGRGSSPPPSSARRWFSVLGELQSAAGADASAVAPLLREALHSVREDDQWNCSGIAELLSRAVELCDRGCSASARQTAVGLLDFHKMVEKYRQVVTRTRSGTPTTSSGSAGSAGTKQRRSDDADTTTSCCDDEACGPLKRQKSDAPELVAELAADQLPEPCPTAPGSAPAPCSSAGQQQQPPRPEFAVPHLPVRRPAPKKGPVLSPGGAAVWTGAVRHTINGRSIDYCRLTVQVPAAHVQELGTELQVAHLAPRRSVGLGQYQVCKCSLLEASRSQMSKLRSMAQKELVAVVALEDNGLLVVPYFDSTHNVKVVCFLLVL